MLLNGVYHIALVIYWRVVSTALRQLYWPEVMLRTKFSCRMAVETARRKKEGNVLFNDALNTFYLRLYGVRHMVKNHSDRERGNPLPPHRLLFPISSKGSFICINPQTG